MGDAEFGDGCGLVLVGFAGGDVFFHQAGADVVVVGAGVNWRGLFDRDFRS